MNYLGHLFFSNNDIELMYANIYGDFVKGSQLGALPEIVQKGAFLHRRIDFYIDNHPKVLELKHLLSDDLPKVAGIAIDLYFDHLLAKNWHQFHSVPLREFIDSFHKSKYDKSLYPNANFQFVIAKMTEDDWVYNYQFMSGLIFACRGLSNRISFSNQLWNAPEIFSIFHAEIDQAFRHFMKDAVPYFNQIFESNEKHT